MAPPVPLWTEELYEPTKGQDHLGLQSVSSDRILAELSPGINVVTYHPRYWSFYSFVLDEFWQRDLPRSQKAWTRFFRPAECIFAIGAHLCDREEHEGLLRVVGSLRVRRLLRSPRATFDPRFDYIDRDRGGYEIYASVLEELGLIHSGGPGGPLPIDAVTPLGREIAAAYRAAVADTTYYREYFGRPERNVPRSVVLEYIRRGCLCQLERPAAPDRRLLRRLFLTGGGAGDARCASLRMLLDIASKVGGSLDESAFRQVIYFRVADVGRYDPRGDLVSAARRWRFFQAHEYYRFALERLWAYLTEWGLEASMAGRHPVAEKAVLAHMRSALSVDLAHALGVSLPELRASAMAEALSRRIWRMARVDGGVDTKWPRSKLDEHRLYRLGRERDDRAVIPAMTALLVLVAARFDAPDLPFRYSDDWSLMRAGGASRLGLDRFIRQLRERLDAGQTVGDVLTWIVDEYVIKQHQRTAMGKLPYDTFRFQRAGGQLRFTGLEARAVMPDPRYEALATVLEELGFVDDLGMEDHRLTADGRRVLTGKAVT